MTVRVAFSALDETIPFRINYVAKGAAKRYSDTAELYWQFIGDETGVPTGPVHIEITPPAPLTKEQVKAWAHGPLTGTVAIGADGAVTLDVPELPANTFVEARVLYPADALPAAPVIDEPRAAGGARRGGGRWPNEANAERIRARVGIARSRSASARCSRSAPSASRSGRSCATAASTRPSSPAATSARTRGPISRPAVIGSLWRFGAPGNADIAATLMDLADKGVIAMRPTTVHHDGILGIGAKDEPSFELGLNPNLPGGHGRARPTRCCSTCCSTRSARAAR